MATKKEPKETWWGSKTRKEKRNWIIALVFTGICLTLFFLLMFARQIFGNEIGDILYGENVVNGFVFLGTQIYNSSYRILATVITILLTIMLLIVINFFINLFSRSTKRSQTLGSLIASLVKYAGIILCIGFILSIWGVNVLGIVASLGILTLIIGLGCQSLINDFVSGLFIVLDDYFSVGDMVIIDGFRGYISEIGLRTVKIDDKCGNIKAITNSSITSCVNLSRSLNYISFTLDAAYGEDLERLEAIFARELPLIKERVPQIAKGPFYKGVNDFSSGGVSHSFAFYCEAQYRFQCTRDVKREIFQMFIRNDILVPYAHIVVDKPEPKRPRATKKEKEASAELLKSNRALKKPLGKEKLSSRIKKAANDSIEEFDKE